MEILDRIANERRRVADFAETLSPEELQAQSWCEAWTVQEVLGHLLMPLITKTTPFLVAMVKSGFNFDKANAALSSRVGLRSVDDLAAGLRDKARHPFRPPGYPFEAPLADILVHTQDMARPLGRQINPDVDSVVIALGFVTTDKRAKGFGAGNIDGVRLVATDTDWSFGDGAEVSGPALDLLLALTSRREALANLEGEGLSKLTQSPG